MTLRLLVLSSLHCSMQSANGLDGTGTYQCQCTGRICADWTLQAARQGVVLGMKQELSSCLAAISCTHQHLGCQWKTLGAGNDSLELPRTLLRYQGMF